MKIMQLKSSLTSIFPYYIYSILLFIVIINGKNSYVLRSHKCNCKWLIVDGRIKSLSNLTYLFKSITITNNYSTKVIRYLNLWIKYSLSWKETHSCRNNECNDWKTTRWECASGHGRKGIEGTSCQGQRRPNCGKTHDL